MKILIQYEYKPDQGTYTAETKNTPYGVIRGSSWESFDAAKRQILDQLEKLRNKPYREPEDVEV